MVVHRHAEVLTRGPDRVVIGGEERGKPRIGRHAGQQDPAEEPMLTGPDDLGDRIVHVVEEDLRHTGPAARRLGAEVGHPTVVGLEAGPAELVHVARRGARQQVTGGEEGRNGVREQHFGHDTVVFELLLARRRIPAPVGRRTLEVRPRIDEGRGPVVEVGQVLLLEVGTVLVHLRARVPVGGDHDVTVTGTRLQTAPPVGPSTPLHSRDHRQDATAIRSNRVGPASERGAS
jgi:hypothetical protein